ncbi:MAG TPA: DedA family protein [Paludibacteraceae bacterium]|nr:DedA family protein [Paludibacteraceae bacterium]
MKKILIVILLALPFSTFAQPLTSSKDSLSIIQQVEHWYDANMNYTNITILMTVESSFIPFPSEIVIPPAAYVASKPESDLNIFLVIFFGTLGAIIGALINYFLALWLGRPIIYKFADSKLGHLLLLSSDKIIKAENYFNEHGKISTFIGRLVPGIRQLISIPAGLSKMNLGSFILYTTLGAGIWNSILALIGYVAHGQADLINTYSHELSLIVLVLIAFAAIWWLIKKLIQKNKK